MHTMVGSSIFTQEHQYALPNSSTKPKSDFSTIHLGKLGINVKSTSCYTQAKPVYNNSSHLDQNEPGQGWRWADCFIKDRDT